MPGFGEDRVQVQHECVSIQTQLAMPEVAADAAADIAGRRCTMIGIETDPLQVGGELQALVALGFGRASRRTLRSAPVTFSASTTAMNLSGKGPGH